VITRIKICSSLGLFLTFEITRASTFTFTYCISTVSSQNCERLLNFCDEENCFREVAFNEELGGKESLKRKKNDKKERKRGKRK
jgi:hypothetical protein